MSKHTSCPLCAVLLEVENPDGSPMICPHCGGVFSDEPKKSVNAWRIALWVVLALVVAGVAGALSSLAPDSKDSLSSMAGAAVVVAIAGFLYFLPSIVACNRKHRNQDPIILLNMFLGWTLLGWVIALIWANTYQGDRRG